MRLWMVLSVVGALSACGSDEPRGELPEVSAGSVRAAVTGIEEEVLEEEELRED